MTEGAPRVLVVDDEDLLRLATQRALERSGFVVHVASSGTAGLKAIRDGQRFDAIVTDLLMPGIHGLEFIRLVRGLDLDVPIIVLTGNPSFESAKNLIEYGGFRYLEKPTTSRS